MKYIIPIIILLSIPLVFSFPQPIGYVNDFANILSNKQTLENTLTAYEQNTTIEIAIVTIEALPEDQTAASYAVELFQEWGIGKRGEDNGILVLIIKNGTTGNRLRIELGYGIQGYITGAEAGRILDAALPSYTAGDYATAAEIIIQGLFDQLKNYEPGSIISDSDYGELMLTVYSYVFLIFILGFLLPGVYYFVTERCPECKSRDLKYEEYYCTCQKCGKRFKRKKSRVHFFPVGGFGGRSGGFGGGGFGGFGGGGSGGGGAGR